MVKKQPIDLKHNLSDKSEHVVRLLRMLAHPQRLCIMCHLSEKPHPVNELVERCGIAQAQVSQFLARMKLEGFVSVEAVGRQRVYRIANKQALVTMKALSKIYCTPTP